jgi:beta-aspartyl-peptidase (threonine type)
MKKIAIAIHGGAGDDSDFIKQNKVAYEDGLSAAVQSGYAVLQQGKSAIDAVEAAVNSLENNPLFNAGRGAALNNRGEVEMDAAIMDGKELKAGAVSMVKNVMNPVSLSRKVMEETNHVLVSGYGAIQLAVDLDMPLETDSYFITDHQQEVFMETSKRETRQEMLKKRIHGTVGAVALDENGNIAAATSTGGTENALPGRIGDSCIIGSGCYANNNTCAVSATGDGEFIITGVIAHSVSMCLEFMNGSLQDACNEVIHVRNKNTDGSIGLISINKQGEIGMAFNSERMHRAWIDADGNSGTEIYGINA